MGIIKENAVESINKTDVLNSTEFMLSSEGRKLIADALIAYLNDPSRWSTHENDRREQICLLLNNVFDVWHERRLGLDNYR